MIISPLPAEIITNFAPDFRISHSPRPSGWLMPTACGPRHLMLDTRKVTYNPYENLWSYVLDNREMP